MPYQATQTRYGKIGGGPSAGQQAQQAAQRKQAESVFARQSAVQKGGGRFAQAQGVTGEMVGAAPTADAVQQMYALLASSPMFANLLRGSMAQGSQANTAVQGALSRTGVGASGVGGVMSGLGSQLPGQAALQAKGQLFGQAAGMGGDIMDRIAALYPEMAKQLHKNYGKRGFSLGPVSVGPGPS